MMRAATVFLTTLVLVAIGAALFAVSFRTLLTWWYSVAFGEPNVVAAFGRAPWGLRLLVPTAGGFASGLVARWRRAPAQGVSNVMEAVVLGRLTLSLRTTASRVTSSLLAIATGFSIGREGPLIEFGGSLGSAVGRLMRSSLNDRRVFVAAGTAAGFAAVYNTPFAAILFVFEAIVGVATPAALLPTMGAAAIASLVTSALVGAGPIYGRRAFDWQPADLGWLLGLAVLAVLVAASFRWVLARAETLMESWLRAQPWRATVGGALVGAIAVWIPSVTGNGYEPLTQLLDYRLAASVLLLLLIGKIVATSVSVGSGVPGGIFTPMLLAGATTGALWAQFVGWTTPAVPPNVGAYALIGMAATTAATIHAPITAAVMVFELSRDYALVTPLILTTAAATALARALRGESVYATELRRRGLAWELTLDGRELNQRSAPE